VLMSLGQISKAVVMLVGALDSLAQAFGGWDTLIVAFSAVMVAKGVWGIYQLVAALGVLSGAIVMTPAGWFILAITAIATAAYMITKHWEPIKKWFSDLWDGIIGGAKRVGDWLASHLPAWLLPGTGGVSAGGATVSTGPSAASVVGAAAAGNRGTSPIRPELSGTLKIEFDDQGRPRVRELRKAPGGLLDFDVYSGAVMVGGS